MRNGKRCALSAANCGHTLRDLRFPRIKFGVVGLYGVISQGVSRRTREIGIRLAIGAKPVQLRWLVIRQGMTLVALAAVTFLACWVPSRGVLKVDPNTALRHE